jgi:sulfate adenylyltransferase subunit 1 (EFTu-like GTPase family)
LTGKSTKVSRWLYDNDVINQTKRIWLKNDDKGWSTKVDSLDINDFKSCD